MKLVLNTIILLLNIHIFQIIYKTLGHIVQKCLIINNFLLFGIYILQKKQLLGGSFVCQTTIHSFAK